MQSYFHWAGVPLAFPAGLSHIAQFLQGSEHRSVSQACGSDHLVQAGPTVGQETRAPWERRDQDAEKARIPCREKAGQLGGSFWTREELGEPGLLLESGV